MTEQWRCAGHAGDLSEDAPLEFKLEGSEIGIYKVGDALYALENVCPHAYALLTQGFVDGDTVECPLHEAIGARASGAATCLCLGQPARPA